MNTMPFQKINKLNTKEKLPVSYRSPLARFKTIKDDLF